MATSSRKLPGLGITGGWGNGENGYGDAMNMNWLTLSTLTQGSVLDIVTALPAAPSQGDIYLMDSTVTTYGNQVAVYDNDAWTYLAPQAGWTLFVVSKKADYQFDGTMWSAQSSGVFTETTSGSVPAPGVENAGKYLRGDGTWATPDSSSGASQIVMGLALYPLTDTDMTDYTGGEATAGIVCKTSDVPLTVAGFEFTYDAVAGATYSASIVLADLSTYSISSVIETIGLPSPAASVTGKTQQVLFNGLHTIPPNTGFMLLVTRTDATATTSVNLYGGMVSNTSYMGLATKRVSGARAQITSVVSGAKLKDSSSINGLNISIIGYEVWGAGSSTANFAGSKIICGPTDPTSDTAGNNGDFYINTVSKALFELEGMTWTQQTTLHSGKVRFLTTAVSSPLANETLGLFVADDAITFPVDFAGSVCKVGTAPAAAYVLGVMLNGTQAGSVLIGTDGTATFTASSAIAMAAGDVLSVVGAATPDSALSGLALNLVGTES